MSGQIQWGKFLVYSSAIMVAGWGLMAWSTPTEEQLYAKLSPELKRKVDEVRRQRAGGQTVRDQLARAEEKDQVVWAGQLGSTKPPLGGRKV